MFIQYFIQYYSNLCTQELLTVFLVKSDLWWPVLDAGDKGPRTLLQSKLRKEKKSQTKRCTRSPIHSVPQGSQMNQTFKGIYLRYRINAKMNQTMYETIINCIFVFMKKMVIPVNTTKSMIKPKHGTLKMIPIKRKYKSNMCQWCTYSCLVRS